MFVSSLTGTIAHAAETVLEYDVEPVSARSLDDKSLAKLAAALQGQLREDFSQAVVTPGPKSTLRVVLREAKPIEVESARQQIDQAGAIEFLLAANSRDYEELIKRAEKTTGDRVDNEKGEALGCWVDFDVRRMSDRDKENHLRNLTARRADSKSPQALFVVRSDSITSENIESAKQDYDDTGRACVYIKLNSEGAKRMKALTEANLSEAGFTGFRRHLGIVVNGRLIAAPTINSVIRDEAVISGQFTVKEAKQLAASLTTERLPISVRFKSRPATGGK